MCAAIYPGTWFLSSGYLVWPDISILVRECGLAIALAAIGAQVTSNYDHRRANIITAALAYLSAQAIWRGFANPGSLNSWSPYPLSHWFTDVNILLPSIFLQAWLLRPVWPFLIHETAEIRKRAALLLCIGVFVVWDWLRDALGSASAAFVCALVMVLVMLLAVGRRYTLFAVVSCAGFLAVSALTIFKGGGYNSGDGLRRG